MHKLHTIVTSGRYVEFAKRQAIQALPTLALVLMNHAPTILSTLCAALISASFAAPEALAQSDYHPGHAQSLVQRPVQLGPRPYFLVEDMDEGPLKERLTQCLNQWPRPSDFSIGHRGACMQFPEHTRESYVAAARMGAGILECDVTFTKDRELVCRHSQCDLHTTTNILATPLAAKCSEPFTPYDASTDTPASARCCTSDITLAEFKTLTGKMDAANTKGTTVEEYLNGTASWRTDLYAGKGTLLSHAESIELFKELGVKMTPELKSPSVPMPYEGEYTQEDYAQQMINEYKAAGVPARRVWAQSFNLDDVLYWIDEEPRFGRQAVYLDSRVYAADITDEDRQAILDGFEDLHDQGVNIVAPPMWALVQLDGQNKIVPSDYAIAAKAADLDIITWTLERDGPLANGGGWYHQTTSPVINNDGDTFTVLDVLARQVGVLGVFSDWPATTTYYANCMLRGQRRHRFGRGRWHPTLGRRGSLLDWLSRAFYPRG